MKNSTRDEIVRRWNAPPEIVYARDDVHGLTVSPNGDLRGGLDVGVSPETVARIKEGRMCARCLEPLERPWQEKCLCPVPVTKEQRIRHLEVVDDGEKVEGKHFGSSINWTEEYDRLDDELERDNWVEHPTLGIIVPR